MIPKKNFTKGVITKKIDSKTYEVRDLLDNSVKLLVVRGLKILYVKQGHIKLNEGEEVYMVNYAYGKPQWWLLTYSGLKDQELLKLKADIDCRIEENNTL